MLAASMSALVGGAVLSTSACSSATPEKSPPAMPENALITLGVQAGPPPVPNKTGISSALKIGGDVYQIDCGLGSLSAFTNAGLRFDELKSMFITHLHTDHIVDYFSFFLSGGYTASKGKAPVMVYGPGPAGGLPPSQVGNPDPATIDSKDPAPGLAATTAALQQAFAYTNNIFIRDMGIDDIGELAEVTEIAVPPGPDYRNRSPKSQPFPVMSDDNVTVTATLLSHYDVYPAFGFRFDLKKSGGFPRTRGAIQPRRRVLPQQVSPELPGALTHLGRTGRRGRGIGQRQARGPEPLRAHRPAGLPMARRHREALFGAR